MTHPVLSRIPILKKFVDERFLDHRRRSSSIAGFTTLFAALCIFEYRAIFKHIISWDMVALILIFAVVKTSICTWLRYRD
jgi:hypothetical protein